MNQRSQAYVDHEVTDGLAAVRAASPGKPVPFYRQPGGTWSPRVVRAMDRDGLTPLRWTDDPRDWSRPGSPAVVRRVVDQVEPGGVILMHDGGGDRTQTVEALRWLLDALPAASWSPCWHPSGGCRTRTPPDRSRAGRLEGAQPWSHTAPSSRVVRVSRSRWSRWSLSWS